VPTAFTPFEPLVRQILAMTPDMPATVIAERVGWTGSITWFRDNVRRLRLEHRPVDPSDRLTWLRCGAVRPVVPAEKACPRGRLEGVVAGHGDHRSALAFHGRPDDPDPAHGRPAVGVWVLLQMLGRVPRRLIWDSESGIGRGKRHADRCWGVRRDVGDHFAAVEALRP
jgi:hypothetical protein